MDENILDELRQPEFTGENRCEACTAVNITLAGILGAVISRRSKPLGAVTVGFSLLLIYLRGYLIPGTPTLTKRYLPSAVLQLFGKSPEPETRSGLTVSEASSSETTNTENTATSLPTQAEEHSPAENSVESSTVSPEEFFLSVGILEECTEKDDLCIEEGFESEWTDEITALTDSGYTAEDVATALGLEGDGHEFTIQKSDQARHLERDHQIIGQWPSEAALIADVAASRLLAAREPSWSEYDPATRGKLLNGLRLFLENCPTTGGEIVLKEETVESCCSSHDVLAAVCEDTNERIFEHQAP